jgi:hypothetical protein
MTEKKKREKVVAEITLAHLMQFARESGRSLSPQDAVAFFNQDGRAYDMWKHMMQAGEQYIKTSLQRGNSASLRIVKTPAEGRRMVV